MARPVPDYRLVKDNRSSYNLLSHDHHEREPRDLISHDAHMPRSPLFGAPSPRRPQLDPRGEQGSRQETDVRYIDNNRGGPLTVQWQTGENKEEADDSRLQSPYGLQAPDYFSGPPHAPSMIKHEQHVPASPLYRPGQGHIEGQSDPRYGSGQNGRKEYSVPRPRDPPTPDFNTTQLHIPDNNNDDDTKLQLGGLRGSQEDLREYRGNNASWAGYQDRPINRGPPYSDRPGYGTDRIYRENPWTSRNKVPGDVVDPRVGGQHDGIGSMGNRNGGALLFIRFPVGQGENIQVAAQSFLKSKTHDNGGRFLGLAKKVYDFGYEKGPTEAVGVFHFPSIDKAFLFFQMDSIIRQPDFPPPYGHAEMWIVCNAYLPDNLQLFNTFLLSEVELHNGKEKREFFETFQKPFESYLYKNGAMPFVVCSYGAFDRKSLRRHNYPPTSIVTCHLFQGLDHLNWITSDETYSKFRSLHNQMATEKCSIFTLSKDMFP